jgi:hypothetical protein
MKTERVQIPAYTDRWMMGDRYGEVTKLAPGSTRDGASKPRNVTIAYVKLDKSGKTVRVVYDDCTPV